MKLKTVSRAARRLLLTLIACLFGFYLLSGVELELKFNHAKAKKAQVSFWGKAVNWIIKTGEVKKAWF